MAGNIIRHTDDGITYSHENSSFSSATAMLLHDVVRACICVVNNKGLPKNNKHSSSSSATTLYNTPGIASSNRPNKEITAVHERRVV